MKRRRAFRAEAAASRDRRIGIALNVNDLGVLSYIRAYIYELPAAYRAIRQMDGVTLSAVFVRGLSSRERADMAQSPRACASCLAIWRNIIRSYRSHEISFTNIWPS